MNERKQLKIWLVLSAHTQHSPRKEIQLSEVVIKATNININEEVYKQHLNFQISDIFMVRSWTPVSVRRHIMVFSVRKDGKETMIRVRIFSPISKFNFRAAISAFWIACVELVPNNCSMI